MNPLVSIIDDLPHTGAILCSVKPMDKSANANSQCRRLSPTKTDLSPLPPSGLPALMTELLADYAATGVTNRTPHSIPYQFRVLKRLRIYSYRVCVRHAFWNPLWFCILFTINELQVIAHIYTCFSQYKITFYLTESNYYVSG
jgi:hypothetical protein